jgi:hypothetical protein
MVMATNPRGPCRRIACPLRKQDAFDELLRCLTTRASAAGIVPKPPQTKFKDIPQRLGARPAAASAVECAPHATCDQEVKGMGKM